MQLYNVHYKASPNNGNRIAYASFLEEYARYSDLNYFVGNVTPYAQGQNFSVVSIAGGLNDQSARNDSREANLDCQYMVGVGWPIPVIEYSVAGRGLLVPDLDQPDQEDNQNEPYLDYLRGLLKLPNDQLPQVISHSYGESEQSVPASYDKQVCNMFAQLGTRGVSVIFASGDSGVGDACISNDGQSRTEFQPAFPAACPWVTTVGGVSQVGPELADSGSGGGFSRRYARPDYQDAAVQAYLEKLGDRYEGYYNRSGRGYPDVAAQMRNYLIYDGGYLQPIGGTSAAAPVFAAIIGLLNDARRVKGLPPLGFLNPWLYGAGRDGLTDIVGGGNQGCTGFGEVGPNEGFPNGGPVILYAGFNATDGWDPVTGLGTPDFGKLLELSTPGVANEGGPVP